MFKAVTETSKTYGTEQIHFYLTQGDSCTIYATPKQNGEVLTPEYIQKCIFRLSDEDYKKELEIDITDTVNDDGQFVLRLTTDDTANLEIASHIYEFEYTLIGGEVHTPNQWKFDITDQIIE